MEFGSSWSHLIVACFIIILGLFWERRRIEKKRRNSAAADLAPIERTIVIGNVLLVFMIIFQVFFLYEYLWIEILNHEPMSRLEMCLTAFAIFVPGLAILYILRRKLNLKMRSKIDSSADLRIKINTNTVLTIFSYGAVFFHLFQYIRISMGWVDYTR